MLVAIEVSRRLTKCFGFVRLIHIMNCRNRICKQDNVRKDLCWSQWLTDSTEQSPYREADSHLSNQEITAFYGTRRFITVFTWARHWSLYWARWIQLTNFMELSPSWEANSHSTNQEITQLLWNTTVHYRVKSPPLGPILSQMNPVN
jgi:hypothetical protein